jgi:predicted nucleotidyltransferase component of viral defense system
VFQTHSLRPDTQAVFHLLAASELTQGFLLIGGTALALHIAHRMSNDLDFLFCEANGKLPTAKIDRLVWQLRGQGCKVDLVTNSAQESTFRINTGERLSDYARDYAIDGVKVTFFAASPYQHPKRFEFWRNTPRDLQAGCAFAVLSLDALKVAKTLVLQDRVRSRDLFDLMVLMRDHS